MTSIFMSVKSGASQLYDADAPFLVESYQNVSDEAGGKDLLPSYSYNTTPHTPGQPRSWDEAARAPTNPIRPTIPGAPGHVYADVNEDNPYLGVGGAPSIAPAPLNATITGYATGLGWELSKLCAMAYAIPPFSSVLLLLWETQNVRMLFSRLTPGSCSFPRLPSWFWRCDRARGCMGSQEYIWSALVCLATNALVPFWIMVLRVR